MDSAEELGAKKIPEKVIFVYFFGYLIFNYLIFSVVCGERGIRTPGASQHDGFQDRCNRPLYHLSRSVSAFQSTRNVVAKSCAKVDSFFGMDKYLCAFLSKKN